MKARRAISPVIATVIIVAVAIAISIAVAGWLFGLWGGFATGTASIQISAVTANYNSQNDTLTIEAYVVNNGSGSDQLIRVEVLKGGQVVDSIDNPGNTIESNQSEWETISITQAQGTYNDGDKVLIKFYFKNSGVIPVEAIVTVT